MIQYLLLITLISPLRGIFYCKQKKKFRPGAEWENASMSSAHAEYSVLSPDLFSRIAGDIAPRTPDRGIEGEDVIRRLIMSGPVGLDKKFLLRIEAFLLHLAYSHNKILSLSNSRTRILAHQVESTFRVMDSLNRRFLIADEVGLGKTIEAGLVIKELEYRHGHRRILIVCPASLLYQWQHEMQSKFNDRFAIMDRHVMRKALGAGSNPWEDVDKIICSLDFIKSKRVLKMLQSVSWDTVIFDEAHRLRRDSRRATLAYEAAQIVSERARALLLLTATPFRGNLEELYFLIALLDKNILGPFQSFCFDYCLDQSDLSSLRKKIAPVLIRRTKADVGGFTRRCARTIRFEFYPDERALYDATTLYVAEEFNRALQSENRAVGFVMTIFQKLLDSSSRALGSALANRARRLEETLRRVELERRLDREAALNEPDLIDDAEDVDDMVGHSLHKTAREIRSEIATLRRLVGMASGIGVDKKAEKLEGLIGSLKKKGHAKFLIFTQFRTTQDFLNGVLKEHDVVLFHGGLTRDEKELAIARFKDDAEILISTEAGGEGRNMQFCNIIINYDLPWSPLKIEQRIGRLHRFGQAKDVFIYNFSTKDTVAERVLEVLEKKLRLFEESIGVPDVLLGEIEDELKLNSLIMEMAAGMRSRKSMGEEVERRIDTARKSFEKISELTVASQIDFNYDEYYRVTLKERTFSNRRIEQFASDLLAEDGIAAQFMQKSGRGRLYRVASTAVGYGKPGAGADGASTAAETPADGNAKRSGWVNGTFDSALALEDERLEFLAFGHPVIDRLVARCQDEAFGGLTGIRVVESGAPFAGMVFYYLASFNSASETRDVIPVAVIDGLSDPEIELIEDDLMGRDAGAAPRIAPEIIDGIRSGADRYFIRARARINLKIERRKKSLAEQIDITIDPEIEKVKTAYDRRIMELQEKLEVLEAQHKWYGRNLKGTITRTKNLIETAVRERDALLAKYRGYRGIGHTVKLICAGVLVSSSF